MAKIYVIDNVRYREEHLARLGLDPSRVKSAYAPGRVDLERSSGVAVRPLSTEQEQPEEDEDLIGDAKKEETKSETKTPPRKKAR